MSFQGETLKVDLALDSPFRFESSVLCGTGIQVNNFFDLNVYKLLAYYGRAEPRDAIDLYFILQLEKQEILFDRAKQKDAGLDAYWFAIVLNRCHDFPDESNRWPVNMQLEWNPKKIKDLFQNVLFN